MKSDSIVCLVSIKLVFDCF